MADQRSTLWVGASWIATLKPSDLSRLREAAKRQMRKLGWPERHINDYQADKLIDWLGPQVVEELKIRADQKKQARARLASVG